MNRVVKASIGIVLLSGLTFGQATFEVTGTPVPPDLLKANFGPLPKSIGAFDINICNLTEVKQTVISSKVYQSLAVSNPDLQPIGRRLVLSAVLRNQRRRPLSVLSIVLTSMGGAFTVLSASNYAVPANLASAVAFASLTSQQLLNSLKPAVSADQIDKVDSQILEPSFLLDGGTCEQRTVFTVLSPHAKATPLNFRVR